MALTRGCSHKRVCGNLPSQAADTLTQLQAFAADEGPKGPSGSGLTAAQLAGAHSRQPRGRQGSGCVGAGVGGARRARGAGPCRPCATAA